MRTHRLRTFFCATTVVAMAACGGSNGSATVDSAPEAPATSADVDGSVVSSEPTDPEPTDPPASDPSATVPVSEPDTSAPTTDQPAATSPPVTEAPTSSAPPASDAPAPETTVAPDSTEVADDAPTAPQPFVLLSDGIGSITFGTSSAVVVAELGELLGAPTSDETSTYPDSDGGYFVDADDTAFEFQFGRSVCFANELCTHFGGDSADSLGFVGWTQREAAGTLTTVDGVGAGSLWADHADSMDVSAGGCYSIGGGVTDGVQLVLQSSGELFGEFTEDEYVSNLPDPADVTVLSMNAGIEPFYLFGDC